MDVIVNLLALATAAASALALYLASPHAGWRVRWSSGALRWSGAVLALASLVAWSMAIGFGPGLCAMLGSWMLALMLLPYLAWWTAGRQPGAAGVE